MNNNDSAVREIEAFVDAIPRPHPALRARVMQSLSLASRPQRGPRLIGAAAVVLAVLVVVTLVVGLRGLSHGARPAGVPASTPAATPAATPSPAGIAGALNVPDGTPVVPFVAADSGSRIAAVPWDGGQPGLLGAPAPTGSARDLASPDGSRFLAGTTVIDRQGTSAGDVPAVGKGISWTWADDSRHLCAMRYPGGVTGAQDGPSTLVVTEPGQAARDVAQVGRLQAQSSSSVLACSLATDTAVVSQSIMGNTTELWTVRLSTGAILTHHTYPQSDSRNTTVAASRDGALLAETQRSFPAGSAPTTTTIVRAADRAVLATVNGAVAGFSWDGQLAAIVGDGGGASVIRWSTGQTIWTAPPAHSVGPMVAEPGGSRMGVWLDENGPLDLWIVGPDGARKAATGVTGVI